MLTHSYGFHLLISCSLLENIRVRRAGYAYRQDYKLALQRYKMLSPKTWPLWKRNPKDGVKMIMQVWNWAMQGVASDVDYQYVMYYHIHRHSLVYLCIAVHTILKEHDLCY